MFYAAGAFEEVRLASEEAVGRGPFEGVRPETAAALTTGAAYDAVTTDAATVVDR